MSGEILSPMTTWLRGGRNRQCVIRGVGAPSMDGATVSVTLRENNEALVFASAMTVEQAMADALNALMAKEN